MSTSRRRLGVLVPQDVGGRGGKRSQGVTDRQPFRRSATVAEALGPLAGSASSLLVADPAAGG
jgi:hypothetical protein